MIDSSKLSLVTGANGFVGTQVVRELLSRGLPVRGMVRSKAKATHLADLDVELLEGNLKDANSLKQALQGVSYVYHIAALFREANVPDSEYEAVNRDGVRLLLDACIEAGVERVVHCSTAGVHGDVAEHPCRETTPFKPGDIYQVTKLAGEQIAKEYFDSGRISGAIIRPGMIYGPGDTRTLKLFRMIARKRFFYIGKGQATVHWIDVRDLARAFVLAMEHSERNGEVYIICGESQRTLREMCEFVASELGVSPPWLQLPVKPMQWLGTACETVCIPLRIEPPIFRRRVDFFTKSRHFTNEKAREQLGFEPAQSFEDEVREIIANYREHGQL